MSWEKIEENMTAFLGASIILLGLIFIPEIRKSAARIIGVIIIVILLSWLGCRKVRRDGNLVVENKKITDSLRDEIKRVADFNKSLSAQKSLDSIKNQEFQIKLFNEFKITRDSISNKPVQSTSTYNTHINKAEKVEIGSR